MTNNKEEIASEMHRWGRMTGVFSIIALVTWLVLDSVPSAGPGGGGHQVQPPVAWSRARDPGRDRAVGRLRPRLPGGPQALISKRRHPGDEKRKSRRAGLLRQMLYLPVSGRAFPWPVRAEAGLGTTARQCLLISGASDGDYLPGRSLARRVS